MEIAGKPYSQALGLDLGIVRKASPPVSVWRRLWMQVMTGRTHVRLARLASWLATRPLLGPLLQKRSLGIMRWVVMQRLKGKPTKYCLKHPPTCERREEVEAAFRLQYGPDGTAARQSAVDGDDAGGGGVSGGRTVRDTLRWLLLWARRLWAKALLPHLRSSGAAACALIVLLVWLQRPRG